MLDQTMALQWLKKQLAHTSLIIKMFAECFEPIAFCQTITFIIKFVLKIYSKGKDYLLLDTSPMNLM